MAALTFDDPPATGPAKTGGALTFDDVPADESGARVAKLKQALTEHLKATRGEPGYADVVRNNLFFGLNQPLNAAAFAAGTGLPGEEPGTTRGERYRAMSQVEQERGKKADEATGWGGTGAAIAASVPSQFITGPAKLLSPVKNALWSAGQGFVEGAAKNSDSLWNAVKGGTEQAGVNLASTYGLDKAMKWLPGMRGASQRAAEAEATAAKGRTPQSLKDDAQALYDRLDKSAIAFDDKQAAGLGAAFRKKLSDANYDPAMHPELKNIVAKLEAIGAVKQGAPSPGPSGWGAYALPTQQGTPITYNELAKIRTQLTDAMRDDKTGRVRRVAGELLSPLDEFVEKTSPAMNLGAADLSKDWPEARRLWKAKSLAEETGWIADKAERRAASTYSGQNADNATRQNFRGVVDRVTAPGAYNPFDKEQMGLLDQIWRGGKIQNAERDVGNWMSGPGGRMVSSALPTVAGIGGVVTGHVDPAAAVGISALGYGTDYLTRKGGHMLRNMAADRGQENVNALLRQITTGSSAPVDTTKAIARDDLAKLIKGQIIGRAITAGAF